LINYKHTDLEVFYWLLLLKTLVRQENLGLRT